MHWRIVADLSEPAGRAGVGAGAELDAEEQWRARIGLAQPGDPLGWLVNRDPRVIHRAGDQQRRARTRPRVVVTARPTPHPEPRPGPPGAPPLPPPDHSPGGWVPPSPYHT